MTKAELQARLTAEVARLSAMYTQGELAEFLSLDQGSVSRLRHGRFRTPEQPHGFTASEVRLGGLLKRCALIPERDPEIKAERLRSQQQESGRQLGRRFGFKAVGSHPLAPEQVARRETTLRAAQARLQVLGETELMADLAGRVYPLWAERVGTSEATLARILNQVRRGHFLHRSRRFSHYVLGQSRAESLLAVLTRLEPAVSEPNSQRQRRILREQGLPVPSRDPAPGVLLEWAAERVRAWIAGGVHVNPLSARLAEQGCVIHQTKLSRLYLHGPQRQDRPDTYLVSPEVAVALVTALTRLGDPPAPHGAVTRQQAAEALGVARSTVDTLVKRDRRLVAVVVGNQGLISRESLEGELARRRQAEAAD